jgi:hypothetical protein
MSDQLPFGSRVAQRAVGDGSSSERKTSTMTLLIGLTIFVTLFAGGIAFWMIAMQGITP